MYTVLIKKYSLKNQIKNNNSDKIIQNEEISAMHRLIYWNLAKMYTVDFIYGGNKILIFEFRCQIWYLHVSWDSKAF